MVAVRKRRGEREGDSDRESRQRDMVRVKERGEREGVAVRERERKVESGLQ